MCLLRWLLLGVELRGLLLSATVLCCLDYCRLHWTASCARDAADGTGDGGGQRHSRTGGWETVLLACIRACTHAYWRGKIALRIRERLRTYLRGKLAGYMYQYQKQLRYLLLR